eukprot:gene15546-biopygen669
MPRRRGRRGRRRRRRRRRRSWPGGQEGGAGVERAIGIFCLGGGAGVVRAARAFPVRPGRPPWLASYGKYMPSIPSPAQSDKKCYKELEKRSDTRRRSERVYHGPPAPQRKSSALGQGWSGFDHWNASPQPEYVRSHTQTHRPHRVARSCVTLCDVVRSCPESTGVGRSRAESGGVERSRAELGGVERSRAESGGVERSRAESSGVGRSRAESGGVGRRRA